MFKSSWTTSAIWFFNGSKFVLDIPLSLGHPNIKVISSKVIIGTQTLRIEGYEELPKIIISPSNINGTSSKEGTSRYESNGGTECSCDNERPRSNCGSWCDPINGSIAVPRRWS
jgi:hypothetical protein